MRKKIKQTLCLLFTVCMILSMINVPVSAKEVSNDTQSVETDKTIEKDETSKIKENGIKLSARAMNCPDSNCGVEMTGTEIHKKTCTTNAYVKECTTNAAGMVLEPFKDLSWYNGLSATQKSNIYIDIPSTAKTLPSNMLNGMNALDRIIDIDMSKASNLESISNNAFRNGKMVFGNIIFPTSSVLKSIGSYAFALMANVVGDVHIPDTVESIGEYAFAGSAFTEGTLKLPVNSKYTSILEGTFALTSLKGEIKIPENVIKIGNYAFNNTNETPSAIRPSGATREHMNAFTKVSWHDGITTIGSDAFPRVKDKFDDKPDLKEEPGINQVFDLPTSLVEIEDRALWNMVPENTIVHIRETVKKVGYNVFTVSTRSSTKIKDENHVIPNLKNVYIDNPNPTIVSNMEGVSEGYSYAMFKTTLSNGYMYSEDCGVVLLNKAAYENARRNYMSDASYEVELKLKDIDGKIVGTRPALIGAALTQEKYLNDKGEEYWSRVNKESEVDTYKFPEISQIGVAKGFQRYWEKGSYVGGPNYIPLNKNSEFEITYTALTEDIMQQQDVLMSVEWTKPEISHFLPKGTPLTLNATKESGFKHALATADNKKGAPGTVYLEYNWYQGENADPITPALLSSDKQTINLTGDPSENQDIYARYRAGCYLLVYSAYYVLPNGDSYLFETIDQAIPNTPAINSDFGQQNYVHFTESPIYNVTFDKQDNSDTPTFIQKAAASNNNEGVPTNIIYIPKIMRPYHNFKEWNTAIDGTGSKFTAQTPVTTDMKVYAQWEFTGQYFSVNSSVTGTNGMINNVGKIFNQKQGDKYTIICTPDVGYKVAKLTVNGVDKTADIINNEYTITNLQGDQTVNVTYMVLPKYTITFDSDGGSSASSIEVYEESAYGVLPTPNKTDFIFEGWYTEKNGEGEKIEAATLFTVNTAQTLYAKWVAEVKHTVSIKEDKAHITRVYKTGINEKDESNTNKPTILMSNKGTDITTDFSLLTWEVENIAGFEGFSPVCEVDKDTGTIIGLKSGVAKVTVKLKEGYDENNSDTFDTMIVIVPGDVNKDGFINALDGITISRVAARLVTFSEAVNHSNKEYLADLGDADGNGKINVLDVVTVKRMASKLTKPSN